MKLRHNFIASFLCCLSIIVCSATDQQLYEAIRQRNLAGIRLALEHRADVHASNSDALCMSAYYGDLPIVQYLVEYIAQTNRDINLALQEPRQYFNVKFLVDYVVVRAFYGYHFALRNAAICGHLSVVKFLLETLQQQRIHFYAMYNHVLREAIKCGHWAAVAYLLHYGADQTKLTAEQLELAQASFDKLHVGNDEALRWAVANSHWDVAACLLEYGADRTQLTAEQQYCLQQNFCTSAQVHAYIFAELRTALSSNDWQAIERVLDIMPTQELPAAIQEKIEHLIAHAALGYTRQRELGSSKGYS